MGGKTQQRVAGNVKPSSSGRIRELLENNHGVGNMITFSVLSTEKQTVESPAEQKKSSSPRKRPPQLAHRGVFKPTQLSDDTFESLVSVQETEDRYKPGIDMKEKAPPQTNHLEKPQEQSGADEKPDRAFNFDELLTELDSILRLDQPPPDVVSLKDLDDKFIDQDCDLIRLLRVLVEKFRDDMSIEDWDLVNRSINRLVGLVSRSDLMLCRSDIKRAEFCKNILDFIHQLIRLANQVGADKTEQERSPLIQLLLEDWGNFYSSQTYKDLIALYFKLAPQDNLKSETVTILESLSSIVSAVDPKFTLHDQDLTRNLDASIEFDTELELPKNCTYCPLDEKKFKGFIATCRFLKSNHRSVLIATHTLLSKTIDDVCDWIRNTAIIDQDENDKLMLVPPAAIMSILTSKDSMMSALLSDYRDVSVTMEPNSDSYSCTLAYLFTWDLLIRFIVSMSKEVSHQIIHCFKRLGLTQRLLDNIFMLLPPLEGRDALNLRLLGKDNEPWCLSDYLKSKLTANIERQTNEIEFTALHIYFSVALHMPVTVRKWYNNNSNRRLCNIVKEYTVKHISQVVCSLEMETVQEKCQERANEDKENNLIIRARPSAKEVYAVYTRDEFKLELTIKLPANYPLSPVLIDGGKRIGVTDVRWRSWLLQLTTFLSHQNGPILDGIDLWRRNIDKRFEGIEKCMICFSILNSNYQLPKKKCPTCSHIFHNLCLYKWFETSRNTTCPLCRNIW